MANSRLSYLSLNIFKLTSKQLTWGLTALAVLSVLGIAYELNKIRQINAFNTAVIQNKTPETARDSFEAKFSSAYWLAKKGNYKIAASSFSKLMEKATPAQKAILQHNIGNSYFLRGLELNGINLTVKDEVEYQMNQAKIAYMAALKIDSTYWGTKHNLDRLMSILPGSPTPGVGESETPGLIMGNIPVGLP